MPLKKFSEIALAGAPPALTDTVIGVGGGTTDLQYTLSQLKTTIAPTFTGFGNPTASVGLSAVNGSATTAMRSDAAPPIDQAITPTWTGLHKFGAAIQFGLSGTYDSTLQLDAANIVALRNGANAQGFRTYNTFTDASNNEIAYAGDWKVTANSAAYGTNANGSGAVRSVRILVGGSLALFFATSAQVQVNTSLTSPQIGLGAGLGTQNAFLTGPTSATLQFGQANAASPVAQTVQAQGSRAGTDSNVGGANLTVKSGQGTGTGTASDLIFQTPVLVASGTGAQTMTTALTLKGATQRTIAATTIGTGGYTVATLPAGVIGDRAYVTDALAPTFLATVVGGGTIKTPVFYDGTNWVGA